ncbi:MAG: GNAT family N-acetyltransferase [Acidobacteriota bacterium]
MSSDSITFRSAEREDLITIVRMLANDPLGATREQFAEALPPSYSEAFVAISADPHNELLVAEREGRVVGVLQLTLIPNLTYEGGWRAQIEGVRVAVEARGHGIGRALMDEAITKARSAGCRLVQLTTDKRRPEALKFYESVGFRATHAGMKLWL